MNYKKYFSDLKIDTIDSFLAYMQNNFNYGWVDIFGKKHKGVNDAKLYSLQKPYELINSKLGICWDIAELLRCFFEVMTSLKIETYYIFYDDNIGCPSHSILVFYNNNKVYWFEPMFNDEVYYYSGIHEYESILELLKDFKRVFIENGILKNFIDKDFDDEKIYIYRYDKPKYHINGYEMRNHIDNSILIDM